MRQNITALRASFFSTYFVCIKTQNMIKFNVVEWEVNSNIISNGRSYL